MSHTPWPWRATFDDPWQEHVYGADGSMVADVLTDEDAHLIAAAPELLEILKALNAVLEEFPDTYANGLWLNAALHNQVLETLAKAEGRE